MAVLDGIRVVVTGSAAALDMASLLLSDNGAEVIRVEAPGGDARRGLPAWRLWNRGRAASCSTRPWPRTGTRLTR